MANTKEKMTNEEEAMETEQKAKFKLPKVNVPNGVKTAGKIAFGAVLGFAVAALAGKSKGDDYEESEVYYLEDESTEE